MSPTSPIDVRFYPPPDDLRRYFTTFYVTRIDLPPGQFVEDALQPEWANLRFFAGSCPDSWFSEGSRVQGAAFTVTGPSSHCCHFRIGASRIWGVGLLPLGWSRFVRQPAADHANLIADGNVHPSFAPFRALGGTIYGPQPDEQGELDRIVAYFRAFDCPPVDDEVRILAIHEALVDPAIDSVRAMVDRIGVGQRTVERICRRAFGFSPKVLLRRQRFMRSLSQFMLDPSLKWIGAIDGQYHDQAQFVRDFHEFMGTTPRDYAARPHPVLERFMHERARLHGTPVQTMDSPEGSPPDHA